MNGRKVISTDIGNFFVIFHTSFCVAFSACGSSWLLFSAGLADVPSGAVCLSASQVLAFGQAAVRLERSQNRENERSLSRR